MQRLGLISHREPRAADVQARPHAERASWSVWRNGQLKAVPDELTGPQSRVESAPPAG